MTDDIAAQMIQLNITVSDVDQYRHQRKYNHERYHSDSDFREKVKAQAREWSRNRTDEQKQQAAQKCKARRKLMYATSEEYRDRCKLRAREAYLRKKAAQADPVSSSPSEA